MTFSPLDKSPSEETSEETTKKRSREDELIEAVFATPAGRELAELWKEKLVFSPVWSQVQPEEVCRHIGGRHSVYRDLITIAERKKK